MRFFIILGLCFAGFISKSNADAIDEKIISTFRLPQNAYSKISVLANLARVGNVENNQDLSKSVNLLEMELVSDIAYLDYIIRKYPDDSEYPKYVLDKIVIGFREGYFRQVKNLQAKNLVISYEENSQVNLKEIYENIKVDPKNEEEFKSWFKRYFPRK